jgi:hypothetical protein
MIFPEDKERRTVLYREQISEISKLTLYDDGVVVVRRIEHDVWPSYKEAKRLCEVLSAHQEQIEQARAAKESEEKS